MKVKTKERILSNYGVSLAIWIMMLGGFFLVLPRPAAAILVSSCGQFFNTTSGDVTYELTNDVYCSTSGFVFGPSGGILNDNNDYRITLDCKGYTIYGNPPDGSGANNKGSAIRNYCGWNGSSDLDFCRENFEIKNCQFANFTIAISLHTTNINGHKVVSAIDDITISNNVFRSGGTAIDADFAHNGAPPATSNNFGTNNIITKNDFLDLEGSIGVIDVEDMGPGSKISYNRFIKKGPYEAVSIGAASGLEIFGNYFDCHRAYNTVPAASDDQCLDDISFKDDGLYNNYGNVGVYDNVFSGGGIDSNPQGGDIDAADLIKIHWCSDGQGNVKKKNIFNDERLSDNSQKVKRPSNCEDGTNTGPLFGCGAGQSCNKACVNPTANQTNTISENTCFWNTGVVDFSGVPVDGGTGEAVAVNFSNPDTILICNSNRLPAPIHFMRGSVDVNSIGIKIDQARTSVIDCSFNDFKTMMQIKNTTDALVRESHLGVYNAQGAQEKKIKYYLQVLSDPYNLDNYRHHIYNPETSFSGPVDSWPEDYWYSNLNVISQTLGPIKKITYIHNVSFYSVNGQNDTFKDLGHFTLARSTGATVNNLTLENGDPISFVGVTGQDPSGSGYFKEIHNNIVRHNSNRGMVFIDIDDVEIFHNTSTDNLYGFDISLSDKIKFLGNTATSTKADSIGAFISGITNSWIGHATSTTYAGYGKTIVTPNTFINNGGNGSPTAPYVPGTGLFMIGTWVADNATNNFPSAPEANVIGRNVIDSNGYWGLVVDRMWGNKFYSNSIQFNGTADDANETISPGFYLNQAGENLFYGNIISNNSGDNLYLDTSKMMETTGCPAKRALTTERNVFLNNEFENSLKGSGIYATYNSQCDNFSHIKNGIFFNHFGYFNPQTESFSFNHDYRFPNFNQVINSVDYDQLGGIPLRGNNTMKNNFLDGVTFNRGPYHDANQLIYNFFYGNEISSNGRDGIRMVGEPNTNSILTHFLIQNVISDNTGLGINFDWSQGNRIFGNVIRDNSGGGMSLKNETFNPSNLYSEIGYATSSFNLALSYDYHTYEFQDGNLPRLTYLLATDTFIKQCPTGGQNNQNFGDNAQLLATGSETVCAGNDIVSLFRFDTSSIPQCRVYAASLTLNFENGSNSQYPLYEMKRSWGEMTATWERYDGVNAWSAPGANGAADRDSIALGLTPMSSTGLREIKLNAAGLGVVQRWIDNPATNFGLWLGSTVFTDSLTIISNHVFNPQNDRPKLSIYCTTNYGNEVVNNGSGTKGIELINAPYTRVASTTINGHAYGIYLDSSSNAWVELNRIGPGISSNDYGIYFQNSDSVSINQNTSTSFIKAGILGFNSDYATVTKNYIATGGVESTGLGIVNSTGWKVGKKISSAVGEDWANKIVSITNPGKYLYVGPTSSATYHPYPSAAVRQYYNHDIPPENLAGGTGITTASKIVYIYTVNDSNAGSAIAITAATTTKHLQIVGGNSLQVTNLNLSDADPFEVDFFDRGSLGGGITGGHNLTNCRGECIKLFGLNMSANEDGIYGSTPIKGVNATNRFVMSDARQNNVRAQYSQYLDFEWLGLQRPNSLDQTEQGDLYWYHVKNSTLRNTNFQYILGDGAISRQWELFLTGDSGQNIIQQNTFASSTIALQGTGAYEYKPGLTTKLYTAGTFAEINDAFCYVESPATGFCDPNCTMEIDPDCANIVPVSGQQIGQCRNDGGNCCLDVVDPEVDPDCLPGVDPVSIIPLRNDNDGLCSVGSGDGCDPNCSTQTTSYDSDCAGVTCTSAPAGPDQPDCCLPTVDSVCDYDCPRGLDPDCNPAGNNWCGDTTYADNTFTNIINTAPNYYEPPPTNLNGGGGKPNGALFCYTPLTNIFSVTQGDSPVSRLIGFRRLPRGTSDSVKDTRRNYKYKFTADLGFADQAGLGLEGTLMSSPDTTDGNFIGTADFYPARERDTTTGDPPWLPGVDNGDPYALGILGSKPIKTVTYAGSVVWGTDTTKYVKIIAPWDGYPNSNLRSRAGLAGTYYAQLWARNNPSSGKIGKSNKLSFSYDFAPPATTWNVTTTPLQVAAYPYKYKVSWNNVVTEPNWSNPNAHYEIWYGASQSEVNSRAELTSSAPGPYVWDDIPRGTKLGSMIPYQTYPTSAGDFAACTTPDNCVNTSYSHDTKLGSRTCAPNGYCQTVITIPSPTIRASTTFITASSTWKYLDDGTDQGTAWKETAFDDSGWLEGAGQLGYGDGDERTKIESGPTNNYYITTYFRKKITIADTSKYTGFTLHVMRDDGAVVYVNGTERFRTNMNAGAVLYNTLSPVAVSGADEHSTYYASTYLSPSVFQNGDNVIAVEVHQQAITSSDVSFDLMLTATKVADTGNYSTIHFNVCAVDNFGNESCSGAPTASSWVETRYGDIYSRGNLDATIDPPTGKYNSTFLVLADGTINGFTSENKFDPSSSGTNPEDLYDPTNTKKFPKKSNLFSTDLGSLDYANHTSFCCGLNSVIKDLEARYGAGSLIQSLSANFASDIPAILNGKIRYRNVGNACSGSTIDLSGATIRNGNDTGGSTAASGAGLIIVNGNLNITGNIVYNTTAVPANIRNLASVAWLVLGDITIQPSVTEVAGTFISLGCHAASSSPDTGSAAAGCGRLSTGASATQLKINGSVFARQFNLERTYASVNEGSEVFIYDGRLIANTPLGLEDFAKNIPIWQK